MTPTQMVAAADSETKKKLNAGDVLGAVGDFFGGLGRRVDDDDEVVGQDDDRQLPAAPRTTAPARAESDATPYVAGGIALAALLALAMAMKRR